MKKLISVIMTMIMVMGMGTIGFAEGIRNNAVESDKALRTNNENRIIGDGINSFVSEKVINGDKIYEIQEGDKKDILTVKANGDIFLDGKAVIYSVYMEDILISKRVLNTNMTRANRTYSTQNAPANTKASEYNVLKSTVRETVTFGDKLIGQLTRKALGVIIGAAFGGGIGAVVGFAIAESIYDAAVSMDPKSNALSAVGKKYNHKNGFRVATNTSAEKHVTSWYIRTNYTGLIETSTHFRVYEY